MKVTVVSYPMFKHILCENNITEDNVATHEDTIFISIIDSKNTTMNGLSNPYKKSIFKKDHPNVLNLQFDDVTYDGENSPTADGDTKSFTKKEGKKIINFLDKNQQSQFCLVHCAAGISRSGAVGQFVNDYFGGNYFEFKSKNNHIIPNPKIVKILNNLAR